MSATTALSVRGLTVARAGRTVLEDVCFSVPAGALAAVLGPAGAGKTSLFATIAGLMKPVRGTVLVDGTDVSRLPPRRRTVGFLPPGSTLPEGRKARDAMGERMAALGLVPPPHSRPSDQLSHGQGALALAAFRLSPPGQVLLVDEAGEGLEAAGRLAMLSLLRAEGACGRTVLLATRDPRMALACDYLVLLAGGRVLQAGAPASLYDAPRDPASALLSGPANILRGTVRELRPGGFVWASAGSRHLQGAAPGVPRPVLGSPVTLCLRPERIALLDGADRADNVLEGTILQVRLAGPLLDLAVRTAPGILEAAIPSWRKAPCPRPGEAVRLGWPVDAAAVLGDE